MFRFCCYPPSLFSNQFMSTYVVVVNVVVDVNVVGVVNVMVAVNVIGVVNVRVVVNVVVLSML